MKEREKETYTTKKQTNKYGKQIQKEHREEFQAHQRTSPSTKLGLPMKKTPQRETCRQNTRNAVQKGTHSQRCSENKTLTTLFRKQNTHNAVQKTKHSQRCSENKTLTTLFRKQNAHNAVQKTKRSQRCSKTNILTTLFRKQNTHNAVRDFFNCSQVEIFK